jgi:hypothetical protein
MHWFVAFLVLPALVALLVWSSRTRSPLLSGLRFARRGLTAVCALLARGLDVVLRPYPSDGAIETWRLVAWTLANLAAGGLLYVWGAYTPAAVATATAVACVLLAAHLLLLLGSVLKIGEENRVMQQGLSKKAALFPEQTAVRHIGFIGAQIALVLLSSALALVFLDRALPNRILASAAATGFDFTDKLLAVMSALPFLGALVNISEFAGHITFHRGLGQFAGAAISVMGSTILVGALSVWVQQLMAIAAIIAGFEEAEGDDMHFLQLIANRAPPVIKRHILRLSLDGSKERAQRRAIVTVPHLRIWTFPTAFLSKLPRFSRDNKVRGLEKIRDFLEQDGAQFANGLLVMGLRNTLKQWRSDKHEEAVKNRLGALAADYATLLGAKGLLDVSANEGRQMAEIAKAHRDAVVRDRMRAVLEPAPSG